MTEAAPTTGDADLESFYARHGYAGPFRAFGPEELAHMDFVAIVDSIEQDQGWRRNRHLDIPAIAEICQSAAVVDRVTSLLGPDLLLWRSNIFAVASTDPGFVWHQDEYRTLIECQGGASQCSVQINFSDATRANCVAIIPGSHQWSDDEFARRGCAMVPGSDSGTYGGRMWKVPRQRETRDIRLKAGEFYIFHPRLLHASVQHRAARRPATWLKSATNVLSRRPSVRYSIALRIATPGCRVLPAAFVESPTRAACVLLSGVDREDINPLGAWAR